MDFNNFVRSLHNMADFLKKTQLLILAIINKRIVMRKNKVSSKDKDFEKKINDICKQLDELSNDFNVDFSFNYIQRDENNVFVKKDTLYSRDISSSSLYIIIDNQMMLKNRIDNIARLIHNGILLGNDKNDNKFIVSEIVYEEGEKPTYFSANKVTGFTTNEISLINPFSTN